MASNPFFSGRISSSLFNAVEAYREQTGESKTEVLTRALAKYIGYEAKREKSSIPPIQEKLDEIFRRLEALENKKITVDNKKKLEAKQLEISNDDSLIKVDLSNQILSTKDTVALAGKGCSPTSLRRWRKENKLPKIINGYQIDNADNNKWKVIKINKDNIDN